MQTLVFQEILTHAQSVIVPAAGPSLQIDHMQCVATVGIEFHIPRTGPAPAYSVIASPAAVTLVELLRTYVGIIHFTVKRQGHLLCDVDVQKTRQCGARRQPVVAECRYPVHILEIGIIDYIVGCPGILDSDIAAHYASEVGIGQRNQIAAFARQVRIPGLYLRIYRHAVRIELVDRRT